MFDAADMVTRENLVMNRGKRPEFCTGLPGKLYNRYDVIGPIVDSMGMVCYKMGWAMIPPEELGGHGPHREQSHDEMLCTLGFAVAPQSTEPRILCKGCRTTNPKDFIQTADKSHMVCRCGVVASAIHISNEREKNCAADEDKTTHADKPYEPKTDRFDHPAQSCEELRKKREQEIGGTRISKKAKQKNGIGWAHEHSIREAARQERMRQEMEPKDQTKGNHIQIELDKLFTPLEPLDNQIKRYIRMEANRAWVEAVRHSKVCQAKGRCQLRVKEKGPAVIADAALTCALNTLLEGHVTLDGVTHSGLLVIADKLGALQAAKGTSCALRAVRTIVASLLAHDQPGPIESCPVPSCQGTPSPSLSSDASAARPTSAPLIRADSSVSDISESSAALLQLRDGVTRVFRHLGTSMPISVRDGTLRAIQDPQFRGALAAAQQEDDDLQNVTQDGLFYVLLDAVAKQAASIQGGSSSSHRGISQRLLASFADNVSRLEAASSVVGALLPSNLIAASGLDSKEDGLFG